MTDRLTIIQYNEPTDWKKTVQTGPFGRPKWSLTWNGQGCGHMDLEQYQDMETPKPRKWSDGKKSMHSLTTILMNITLNVQAGLDCSSMKTAWDSLMGRYAQADPIVQNLTHAHLHAKHYIEGNMETSPGHIAELQRLREACGGLAWWSQTHTSQESLCSLCQLHPGIQSSLPWVEC